MSANHAQQRLHAPLLRVVGAHRALSMVWCSSSHC
jgi:hypothetical protein